jgi:hypothetical protein
VLLYCAALAAAPAAAGEFAYGGGYSLAYETNPNQLSAGARDDWVNAAFGGIAYQERTDEINVSLQTRVEKRVYQSNEQLNNTEASLSGIGVWTISPRLLSWTVEDSLRNARIDVTAADSPVNRTEVNSFRTGPDLNLRFSPTNSSAIGARYGKLDSDISSFSNETLSAYVRWIHALSQQSTLSLNYEAQRSKLEEASTIPEATRTDLYARFETRPLPNTFALDVGTTRVSRAGADDLSGRLVQLTAARQFTPQSVLRISYLSRYSDTFSDMIQGLTNPTVPGETAQVIGVDVLTSDLYYSQRGEIVYSSDDGRVVYGLRGYARQVDYEALNLDFDELGARADWGWHYTGSTQVYAMASYLKRDFEAFPQVDVDRNATLGARFAVNQNVSLSVEAARTQHETTGALGSFLNSRVMLVLGYSSGPLFAVRSR